LKSLAVFDRQPALRRLMAAARTLHCSQGLRTLQRGLMTATPPVWEELGRMDCTLLARKKCDARYL
jgi:hypothetical protein